ncbi:MAG: response regulator [Chloroflexi bacterium]|nr:response regulator [Chloroflexota bacterium]
MVRKAIEILLVEDNPNDVELTLHALRSNNIANEVHVARDGEEALEMIFGSGRWADHPERPAIVLLDLKLPKVDGLEVLRKLKTDPRTQAMPVVVLTSSREEPDIAAAYQLGANSYIVKPVDFDQFLDCVRQLGLYWLLLNEHPPENALEHGEGQI